MKDPHRRRTFWLFTFVGGLVLCVLPFVLSENPRTPWLFPALFGTGLIAVTSGGLFVRWSHVEARLRASLLQNNDVLARWRVDLSTWQQFIALNRTFSTNEISVPAAIPPDGIDVIVGPRGMMIGGYVHTFNHRTNVNGVVRFWGGDFTILKVALGGEAPCCLYFYVRMMGQETSDVFTNLIFPVPPHAISEATTVRNYFHGMLEPSK